MLHAGAVTGPGGAVVIRGSAGAGKSTLVAAAYRSGLGVLGDESVLAARSDPDDLLSAVRDITVLPDARSILGLDDALTAPAGGSEDKRRLDLFASSTPAVRRARRVATVLLGSRNGGPARLEPLPPEAFLRRVPSRERSRRSGGAERRSTLPSTGHGAARTGCRARRISRGAVALLTDLVSRPAAGEARVSHGSAEHPSVLLAHSYYMRYDTKQSRKMKPYPPLSTLIAAGLLRREGQHFAFFDSMLSDGVDEFRDLLHAARPKVVGLLEDNFNFLTKMCTTRMREAAFEMIAAAKSAGARVVVNGSDAIDQTAAYLHVGADAVILGEAEETFLDVTNRYSDDLECRSLPGSGPGDCGAMPRRGLRFAGRPRRHSIRDLDALPFPAWDLIDVERYRVAWTAAHGRLSWNVCTSRGCPYACNWCAKPVFGRRYTQRTAANVAEELAQLRRAVAPDHVWFADDIFGITPRWIESFAAEVRSRGAVVPFTMQSRVNLMTPSAVEALAEARCEEVWMGVESGAQHVLDAMDKGTTLDEVREGTRRLKQHGIRACWFVQLGYPGEDWDAILQTRDLIRDEQPDDIGVSVAYPLPGDAVLRPGAHGSPGQGQLVRQRRSGDDVPGRLLDRLLSRDSRPATRRGERSGGRCRSHGGRVRQALDGAGAP